MTESELYRELGVLTKEKSRWRENIRYVSSLLSHDSVRIRAKVLWLIGEMGLIYPKEVKDAAHIVAGFLFSTEPLLRERALIALGRIGRGHYGAIERHFEDMFRFSQDENPKVRLGFIWASENIATNTPDVYGEHMQVFEKLLDDENDRVRMEAPEIFRVLGKRRPEFVVPYIKRLEDISQSDENRVVRIHCAGALKATLSAMKS